MAIRFGIIILLVAAVCAVYAQTARFDFVNYDDPQLYGNPHIHEGVSAAGLRWAFTANHVGNYIPLTLLSYLADYEWAGLGPGAYHVTNTVFHAANAILLFLALHALTERTWPSALAAALFAIHPLHVESVAWISERKDVLSTFFGLLALWAYAVYARAPHWWKYALVMALLVCSLLSKAMFVTFPFLLLVLDFWPLSRTRPGAPLRRGPLQLVVEKLPLIAVVTVFSWVTLSVQRQASAVAPTDFLDWGPRIGNALVSYVRYLGLTIWPQGLIPYYPHPGDLLSGLAVAGSAAVLIGISGAAWLARRRAPYLLAGWLWYLGTLVPVIGLVQVGSQAMADRYTYVPLIGIFIAAAWGLAEFVDRRPRTRLAVSAIAVAVLVLLAVLAHAQTARWRNSIRLYEYTLTVSPANLVALPNLGEAYLDARRYEDAVATIERALQLGPNAAGSRANLGLALRKLGRVEEAEWNLRESVRLAPESAQQRTNYALALMDLDRFAEARNELNQALALDPRYAGAHVNLGNLAMREGNLAEAESHYRAALAQEPHNADAMSNLGALALMRKDYRPAEEFARAALAIAPDDAVTRTNLALALMNLGDTDGARREAETALQDDPEYTKARVLLDELARRTNP